MLAAGGEDSSAEEPEPFHDARTWSPSPEGETVYYPTIPIPPGALAQRTMTCTGSRRVDHVGSVLADSQHSRPGRPQLASAGASRIYCPTKIKNVVETHPGDRI
jgi:hypothetical protein